MSSKAEKAAKANPSSFNGSSFVLGGAAALETFLEGILHDRGQIENAEEPVFDVIVDLLKRAVKALEECQS